MAAVHRSKVVEDLKWRWRAACYLFVGAGVFAIGVLTISYVRSKTDLPEQIAAKVVSRLNAESRLSREQISKLDEVNDFISGKDEQALRDTFDMATVEKDSLLEVKKSLFPNAISQVDNDALERDIEVGRWTLFLKYSVGQALPDHITTKPGKMAVILITRKHIDSRALLASYSSSALIPKDVATAVTNLDQAVEENLHVLIDAINEGYSISPKAIENSYAGPKTGRGRGYTPTS